MTMKFYLISDNIDTQIGMRLAGIEGIVLHEKKEIAQKLEDICNYPEYGIILITEKLMKRCPKSYMISS